MNDPRRDSEMGRRNLGCERILEISRSQPAHPIRGSRGYPVVFRQLDIINYDSGLPIGSSERSIRRWKNRLDPFLMSGNKDREVIIGLDQYHLCLFLIAYPEAHLDEIATFIANAGDGVIFPNPRLANE